MWVCKRELNSTSTQTGSSKMLLFLVCVLTCVHHVHSACTVESEICPENKAVQAEIVDQHNAFRRDVQPTASNMLKMSWSDEAAANAQAWLNKCILAHGPASTRMIDGYELGENLFYSSVPYSWTDVVSAWYGEVAHYRYPNGSTTGQTTGHYTQVIWNSSYKVGCGVTLCPNGVYFYGCHYYRAGNFKRWPPYKAGPPCASCPHHCEDKLCTNPCPYINNFLNCPTLTVKYGCRNTHVYAWCPAACKCHDQIIPIH